MQTATSVTMHSLQQLIEDHQQILGQLRGVKLAIENHHSGADIRARLLPLLDLLTAHLAIEDHDIYPKLVVLPDQSVAAAARDAIERFASTADDWREYGVCWTADRIDADPAGFADATRRLVDALLARVRTENDLLYPLALQSSAIRLRA